MKKLEELKQQVMLNVKARRLALSGMGSENPYLLHVSGETVFVETIRGSETLYKQARRTGCVKMRIDAHRE